MTLHRIPAVFMRGGTSKALLFHARDLPHDIDEQNKVFLSAMGVPDPYGRQLDGMGGGVSSLNKVCIVGPPSRSGADVDYTFVQLGTNTPLADRGGNCGNMSSAIGPFAVEEGLVSTPGDGEATVRIHNTNTGKIIAAHFPVANGALPDDGNLAIDGVAGSAAPIRLEFLDPGGAKTGRLLPTGAVIDTLSIPGFGQIEASLVDAANPCVFIAASSLGYSGAELPDILEKDTRFATAMEAIRCAGSVQMGLASDMAAASKLASVPKVAMLAAPADTTTLSGKALKADDTDIMIRMISVGQPHRAVPITGAICLAIAARIPGSIAEKLSASSHGPIRIGHPSGIILVDSNVTQKGRDGPHAISGSVYRTARRLFEGHVLYRAP